MTAGKKVKIKLVYFVKKGFMVWVSYTLLLALGLFTGKFAGYITEPVFSLMAISATAGLAMSITEFALFRKVVYIPGSQLDNTKSHIRKLHYFQTDASGDITFYSVPGNRFLMRSLDIMLIRLAGQWYLNVNIFHSVHFK